MMRGACSAASSRTNAVTRAHERAAAAAHDADAALAVGGVCLTNWLSTHELKAARAAPGSVSNASAAGWTVEEQDGFRASTVPGYAAKGILRADAAGAWVAFSLPPPRTGCALHVGFLETKAMRMGVAEVSVDGGPTERVDAFGGEGATVQAFRRLPGTVSPGSRYRVTVRVANRTRSGGHCFAVAGFYC